MKRWFKTTIFHQKITTDTTEFKYYENGNIKKAYLDPFLDLFNREVIPFSISKQPSAHSIVPFIQTKVGLIKCTNTQIN
jgi:hypothetical protein